VNANNTLDAVARSASGFDEEEILTMLTPGNYMLRYKFYNWYNLKGCAFFSMEVSLQPARALPPLCPQSGSDFWPPAPPSSVGSHQFSYDSAASGDYLYFQQRTNEKRYVFVYHEVNIPEIDFITTYRTKTYSFDLDTESNIYVDVEYYFASDLLMATLKNTKTGTLLYANKIRSGALMIETNIPAGSYELSLFEVCLAWSY